MVDGAIEEGRWLILAGHDVGNAEARQMTRTDALTELCRYCRQRAADLWVDTVSAVAAHVQRAARQVNRHRETDKEQ